MLNTASPKPVPMKVSFKVVNKLLFIKLGLKKRSNQAKGKEKIPHKIAKKIQKNKTNQILKKIFIDKGDLEKLIKKDIRVIIFKTEKQPIMKYSVK